MASKDGSRTIRAGATTYFFEIKKTRDGEPFLVITESRFVGEDKDYERASIAVFPENAQEFLGAAQEMLARLEVGEEA